MLEQTISHYEIIEELGRGGMGVVYKALDIKLDRFVALKFLPFHLSQNKKDKERFIHEAKAASALDHPNICNIYEIDETEDGQLFISMGYYEGESLRTKIENSSLGIEEAMAIALQVADGIREAHNQGIIHRDIKPANVMITHEGKVKILDFGLAKVKGTKLTKEQTSLGTLPYMSPEQILAKKIDQRTDIWSFGVLVFEMITAHSPFDDDNEQILFFQILNENAKEVSSFLAETPKWLDLLIKQSLEKNPENRFQKMDEILEIIENNSHHSIQPTKIASPREKLIVKPKLYIPLLIFILVVILYLFKFWLLNKPSTAGNHKIVVLPTVNISPDENDQYFAEGMTEELISTLTKINDLNVTPRTSVKQYKNTDKSLASIGREMEAQTILESTIRKSENNLRITTNLYNAGDESLLWSDVFDRRSGEIFSIQTEIAEKVADALKLKLGFSEKQGLAIRETQNPAAFDLYHKGRYLWDKRTPEALEKAIELFKNAINLDPGYALAYTGLSDAYHFQASYSVKPPREVFPQAKEAAKRALEINKNLAEAHHSLAGINLLYDWDWQSAENGFKRAIELKYNYIIAYEWYSICLIIQGRMNEAFETINYALKRYPVSLTARIWLGRLYYFERNYTASIKIFREVLEFEQGYFLAHVFLAMTYLEEGSIELALDEFQFTYQFTGGKEPGSIAGLAYVYARLGKKEESQRYLDDLEIISKSLYVHPFYFAAIYLALGENETAIDWLQRGYDDRSEWMIYLSVDPIFDPIRSDPRFTTLVDKMGLN